MFAVCADPKTIEGLTWAFCYLTSGKHLDFYGSFLTVILLLVITAPCALALGFGGATAARSQVLALRILGKTYIAMVRGIPDIIFFLFFVIALDQGIEYLKNLAVCPAGSLWPWQGLEFRVCQEAKVPLGASSAFWHNAYGFALAVFKNITNSAPAQALVVQLVAMVSPKTSIPARGSKTRVS